MFLWFCPKHGHCYGFHIGNGSGGQKDAAYSLYTHLPEAPEILLYDFTCGLEEYCLKRELVILGTLGFIRIFSTVTVNDAPLYTAATT